MKTTYMYINFAIWLQVGKFANNKTYETFYVQQSWFAFHILCLLWDNFIFMPHMTQKLLYFYVINKIAIFFNGTEM